MSMSPALTALVSRQHLLLIGRFRRNNSGAECSRPATTDLKLFCLPKFVSGAHSDQNGHRMLRMPSTHPNHFCTPSVLSLSLEHFLHQGRPLSTHTHTLMPSPYPGNCLGLWVGWFYVSLTQARVFYEEGTPVEKTPP